MTLAIALVISVNVHTQNDRNVMYVHGWGEDDTTWDIYDSLFDLERQHDGRSPEFIDNSGGAMFANGVSAGVNNNFPGTTGPNTLNIGIGHSFGGLAVREVDRRVGTGGPQRFGAFITVGSPNNGAQIINSIRAGDVTDAMDDACEQLSAGPLVEPIPFVYVQAASGVVTNDVLCRLMSDLYLDGVFQDEVDGPSGDDMEVGSDFITALNNTPPNVPSISIWGNENSPVHWRLVSSMATGNDTDDRYVKVANTMETIYAVYFYYHSAQAVVGGVFGIFFPPTWVVAIYHGYQATQWNKGRKWFDQSEGIWNGLIGCTGQQQDLTVSYTTLSVDCTCYGPTGTEPWIDCVMNLCGGSLNGCYQTITTTISVTVNDKSDGLLCDQTQILDGLPAANIFEAKGVNHNEETNTTNGTTDDGSDVIGDTFREIWDRSDIFRIEPR